MQHISNCKGQDICCGSAAEALTYLLESKRSFSYLRLGDGETQWIRAIQEQYEPSWYCYHDKNGLSLGRAIGTRGLEARHYGRLMTSLERCDYLDYCQCVSEANRDNLEHITIDRPATLHKNPSAIESNIIFAWAATQLSSYTRRHRCMFASAEASIHQELLSDPTYKNVISEYLPDTSNLVFHQIRDDGRNYSENLDAIKEDLKSDILRERVDTLFLSLATGAKIICFELAEECGIRAVDWGALSRGLIYCGSPGYHTVRADHTPFFVHVPFDNYMQALMRAKPKMLPEEVLLKAHSQIMLEVQRKVMHHTTPADVNLGGAVDLSSVNLRRFWEAMRIYRREYYPFTKNNPSALSLHVQFRSWRRSLGLGIDGIVFRHLVRIKGFCRRVYRSLGSLWGASSLP